MDEAKIPQSVMLLGGGPWAVEMAQFITAAGSQATVVEESREILPGEDSEICQRLRRVISDAYPVSFMTSAKVAKVVAKSGRLEVSLAVKGQGETVTVDRIVYFDRKPKLDGIGLDTVGLKDLSVDDYLATSVEGIWSLGDVIGTGPELSHRASFMGVLATENIFGPKKKYNPNIIPRVVYTNPQMACVGLTEEQAEDLDYDVVTGEVPLGVSPMAMIQGQSTGMIKVVGEEKYGELLGVHLVCPFASELISAGTLAIQMEATLEELASSCMPHPTIAEYLTDAAREALGRAIYLPK
jgi:dihydrolipoamide dehydrogenase